jgi:ribonucleoside-diphosphate reductase beta chain
MSFNRNELVLSGISNAVEATSKEEQIHGDFGVHLLDIIRKENPDWFDDEFEDTVYKACSKAFKAEQKILDWIFEKGELEFLSRADIDAFVKDRFNRSLDSIGLKPKYEVTKAELSEVSWFEEEILSSAHVDFFHKRPTSYSKFTRSYGLEDLF